MLLAGFRAEGVTVRAYRYDILPGAGDPFEAPPGRREAGPQVVDAIVEAEHAAHDAADVVIGFGGGSAVDAGKALSAALILPGSIREYLEGVGTRSPDGKKVPFIAIPTTAGTGSEVTKNAVLSDITAGYKKSLRHDNYVPDLTLIDPELQLSCPRDVTAASGMDAVTQLLEALLSTRSSPLTDALAIDGLVHAGRSYARAVERGDSDVDARAGMAYAAYLSGRCLANAGLGVVHGLAGPAGAHSAVPHGLVCGALLRPATERLVSRLRSEPAGSAALVKLAGAGYALTGSALHAAATGERTTEDGLARLLTRLAEFERIASFPRLSAYGLTPEIADQVAGEASNKNSPVDFTESERRELLHGCL